MIFLTIGLMYGFDRLVKEMDRIAERIDEEVIMQIGKTTYVPKKAKYFRFASQEEMDILYENARVVVCHAGVGSLLSALKHNKLIISVPRRKEYGEVIDDHQVEIAKELEKEKRITMVNDVGKLEKVLANASAHSCLKVEMDRRLTIELRNYINKLNK